ncbi:MAG TPA: site-specific DNA-methyltransferase [Phycisphaerales bacterium]|nr:site-specific DNA-methyltransferase [Phycisphaerales bacterium]
MPRLDFKGKAFVRNYHMQVKYHRLCPVPEKSLTDKVRLNDNLIIHGDNLKALKALLPLYGGKIKCIYIDPPYNTGNEGWRYNDNVNSPMMQEWLGKVVDREDLTRHDKWLCMMMPRLKLLRELLSEDGVLCISIDDTELGVLLALLDEIFGEGNREEVVCWRRRHNQPNDKSKPIAKVAEFIVIYARDMEILKRKHAFRGLPLTGKFSNPDNDPRGEWATKPWKAGANQTGTRYKITTPGGSTYDEEWLGTEDTYKALLEDGRIHFSKNGTGLPRKKYFKFEREEEGQCAHNFWGHQEFGHNQEATEELNELGVGFDNPKPSRLLRRILDIFTGGESIVLDSFAGSGTTGHATLALNAEDGGNRRFILVECEDYADRITAERVRRVIRGVPGAKDDKLREGLGGSFSYFELGDPLELEGILSGEDLPSYEDLARYIFYTATGEEFDPAKVNEEKHFIGETEQYRVYLFYKPDLDYLKQTALTLEEAKKLGPLRKKRRLVFAPTKYLDQEHLDALGIEFAWLPFEIYSRVT